MPTCRQCQQQFTVYPEDKEFYQKFNVLESNLCPECRAQARMAFRNERFLYTRKCDKCRKNIISVFSPDKDYVVYCHDCWYSDIWNPHDYALNYDFNESFFAQFNKLMHQIPMPALIVEKPSCINSNYINDATDVKNCYLTFDISYGEDCYYGETAVNIKDCVEFLNTYDCELCHEVIYCNKCYNVTDFPAVSAAGAP